MDKELIEKVTQIVLEKLKELKLDGENIYLKQSVKIWPHQTPLPDPIILKYAGWEETKETNQMVSFSPYQ